MLQRFRVQAVVTAIAAIAAVTVTAEPASAATFDCSYYLLNGIKTTSASGSVQYHTHVVNQIGYPFGQVVGAVSYKWIFRSGTWSASPNGSKTCW
jgi:hypothetical protein